MENPITEDIILNKRMDFEFFGENAKAPIFILGITKTNTLLWFIPPINVSTRWSFKFIGSQFVETTITDDTQRMFCRNRVVKVFGFETFMERYKHESTELWSVCQLGETKSGICSELSNLSHYLKQSVLTNMEMSFLVHCLIQADSIATVVNNFEYRSKATDSEKYELLWNAILDYDTNKNRIDESILPNLSFMMDVIIQQVMKILTPPNYPKTNTELKDDFILELEKNDAHELAEQIRNIKTGSDIPFNVSEIKADLRNQLTVEKQKLEQLSKIYQELEGIIDEKRTGWRVTYHTKPEVISVLQKWWNHLNPPVFNGKFINTELNLSEISNLKTKPVNQIRLFIKQYLNNNPNPKQTPYFIRLERLLRFLQ